jgi:alkylmercury lyase
MTHPSLPKYDLQELAAPIQTAFDADPDQFALLIVLQQLLLDGQPVSQERIAARFHMPLEEVPDLIGAREQDADGNFVGFGLTLVPTPHSYQIRGHQFSVWCSGDAIMFPILHHASAVIASPDPISGELVRLVGTPNGARDVDPSTAVVSWVRRPSERITVDTVRAALCSHVHFFASVATAKQYVAPHPELVIVPIDDVFQIGQLLWEQEPLKSKMAALTEIA